MKKALITGITGQDGTYLAEFLLSKNYQVHGIIRRSSQNNIMHIEHLIKHINFNLHSGDVTDSSNMIQLVYHIKPHEIYNLAAQSDVHVSFNTPEYTAQTDALGPLRLLEAIRLFNLESQPKFYQASTSELYGNSDQILQSETTPFSPRSPYAIAKLYAYWITVHYRQAYNIFACNGILFNHESPRRGENFVTRKITKAVARIYYNLQNILYVGNLDAKRDWGYAPDYIEAMWLMLQQNIPEDFVIATGETHSVREFVELAFTYVGIKILWRHSGIHEQGINSDTKEILVAIDPKYFRPTDVQCLQGDATKARLLLNWKPKMNFQTLVKIMVDYDLQEIQKQQLLRQNFLVQNINKRFLMQKTNSD